ncbi:MAG: DUF4373 domain-containing protein [Patescibacteria group bacterium]|nr:DUF4373 domain-containing protein [Patescibacteria group bacterium]
MNKDYRLIVGFFEHPKTKKLKKRLGWEGVISLIRLWEFTAQYRPDGVLGNMSDEDIELAASWDGDESVFVKHILEYGFIQNTENGYEVHDWQEHNGYACHAKDREEQARKSANARWDKQRTVSNAQDEKSNAELCSRHAHSNAVGNAPSPSPSPSPLPDSLPVPKDSCAEPEKEPAAPPEVSDPIFINLITNTKSEYPIRESILKEMQELYPGVDINQEFRNMRGWCIGHPTECKTEKGMKRFFTGWLGRAQNDAAKNRPKLQNTQPDIFNQPSKPIIHETQ